MGLPLPLPGANSAVLAVSVSVLAATLGALSIAGGTVGVDAFPDHPPLAGDTPSLVLDEFTTPDRAPRPVVLPDAPRTAARAATVASVAPAASVPPPAAPQPRAEPEAPAPAPPDPAPAPADPPDPAPAPVAAGPPAAAPAPAPAPAPTLGDAVRESTGTVAGALRRVTGDVAAVAPPLAPLLEGTGECLAAATEQVGRLLDPGADATAPRPGADCGGS